MITKRKKKEPRQINDEVFIFMAGTNRFERLLAVLETDVLPLH